MLCSAQPTFARARALLLAALSTQCVDHQTRVATDGDATEVGSTSDGLTAEPSTASEASTTQAPTSPVESSSAGETSDAGTFMLDGAVPEEPLCDGSHSLRLAITRTPPHLGGAGDQWITFPYALGMNSIYVRGDCQYWIQEGLGGRTQLLRTGKLTEELAAELARDMHYSQLDQFDDHYGDHLDLGGYFVVSGGRKAVWCRGYCTETPTAPRQLQEMEARYPAWNTRLLSMSSDVTGPMWALFTEAVNAEPADATNCDLSWPFSFEPGPFTQVFTPSGEDLKAILIDVPEAQELRSWWRNNLDRPNPCYPTTRAGTSTFKRRTRAGLSIVS